jgi:non-specific serine/threonine protein kinase/serine/threonine-protein kinase
MSRTAPAAEWQKIKSIFLDALELAPDQRREFLDQVCSNDFRLRSEVERMIAADESAKDFLENTPVASLMDSLPQLPDNSPATQRIGHYKIIREIGEGGMGTVYLAERDDEVHCQQVAIKVLSRGPGSQEMRRRFRRERLILASLNHPNIARLLDGGTTEDGRPYYVMEYIAGCSVDEYCDVQRFSITARLRLFQEICHAVHYAHQRLIIHRDLKPSNILVNEEGVIKLLDFGIAKLLTDAAITENKTATGFGMMTPGYASPEQVRGETIGTTSDVYSLGIILHELLTGVRPYNFQNQSIDEIVRVVCESIPLRPSLLFSPATSEKKPESNQIRSSEETDAIRLHRRLRGDLDTILLKSLHKDPQRRYSSAEQLSTDVERHLSGLPILARPDTIRYRASKFIQRNRKASISALLIALLLMTGIIITTFQARIARRERAVAERRYNEVRRLANSFVIKYQDAIAGLPGSIPVREMMVKDAIQYLDSLNSDAGKDMELNLELAQAYLKIGDMQGKPYHPNLGDTYGALLSYQKALALCESVILPSSTNAEHLRLNSLLHSSTGALLVRAGKSDEASEHLQKAESLCERGLRISPDSYLLEQQLSLIYLHKADAALRRGGLPNESEKTESVLNLLSQSLQLREKAVRERPGDPVNLRALAICHQRIGRALEINATKLYPVSYSSSLEHHRQALYFLEKAWQTRPDNIQAKRDLTDQYLMKASVEASAGNARSALNDCQRAVSEFSQMVNADPKNAELHRDLATAWYVTANIQEKLGSYADGINSMKNSLKIFQKLAEADPANQENHQDISNGIGRIIGMQTASKKASRSFTNIQEINGWYEQMIFTDLQTAEWRRAYSRFLRSTGESLFRRRSIKSVSGQPVFRQTCIDLLEKSLALQTQLTSEGKFPASELEQTRNLLTAVRATD